MIIDPVKLRELRESARRTGDGIRRAFAALAQPLNATVTELDASIAHANQKYAAAQQDALRLYTVTLVGGDEEAIEAHSFDVRSGHLHLWRRGESEPIMVVAPGQWVSIIR